ncbi:unnamed protein product, partial [marine sediment metagenome]
VTEKVTKSIEWNVAFVLANAEVGKIREILSELRKIEGVAEARV